MALETKTAFAACLAENEVIGIIFLRSLEQCVNWEL
jgi:hypothetical protein